ncbi:acetylcholine receptor subunit alpha-like [Dreissena polymorpha]|uniref:Uncharacterized protein n=1 Tax=Dreissena polymorpha TaxID=45954 RepID=A0A9D4FKC1_DREPO|nr:acetylcholine receptor subunit alpha-like [Dreissena polymorpha]KAH3797417.1 hypothetical protein DPMN_150998 [Dreissena polymorpha]
MPSSGIGLLVLIGHASHVVTQTGNDAKRLYEQMFVTDMYNKWIRPVDNQSSAIDVYVNLYLLSINDLIETDEVLTTTAFLSVSWNDTFLKWDPHTFGGIKLYHWPQDAVWKPDIALHNSYLDYKGLGDKTLNVLNRHTGAMNWNPFQVFKSTCSIDVFYFPFDYQTCYLRFQAWSFSRRQVHMKSGFNASEGFNLEYYETNTKWGIVNTSWHVYRDKQDAAINFKMTLKRKPMYFMMSVLLPICMLSILNICVYMIPVNSGEKAGYAVTVFLSFAVFLSIVSDTNPQNSETTPLITYFLVMQTASSALTTMLALVFSRLESFGDAKVPSSLVKLMNLMRCRPCLSCARKTKGNVIEPIDDSENATDTPKKGPSVKIDGTDAVNFLDFMCFVLFSLLFIISIMVCYVLATSKGRVYNEEFNYKSKDMYEQYGDTLINDGTNTDHSGDGYGDGYGDYHYDYYK